MQRAYPKCAGLGHAGARGAWRDRIGYVRAAMVWEPSRIAPKSWAEVVAFYRDLESRNHDFRPLRVLVEHVAARAYAASIVAGTSGTALLVAAAASGAVVASVEWASGALRVDLDLSGSVRFAVPAGGQRSPRVITLVHDASTIATFERTLRDAKWIG
ncbi:MAG TPA: hypothetical protein VH044_13155 [Polyangiaceae bacterium]|jgi:hypothetical protein|nr:hypothetical protein [Polyangiaceae bacterium]